ncbi:ribosome silencing factor [Melaminivora sp.]|uniref:ribosome silencing factor n=1 Tax=Melaminivora sp. TaxID=1933032 RepID=UPI0028A848B3|nr:ribosome silencing factor [Melaminivora sp.]
MTTSPQSETAAKRDVTRLQRAIVDGLEDVKAHDIQVFDTEHLSPLFERVVVATGTSNRQTKALAASVRDAVREAGFAKPRTEGEDNGEWIIVDCGQVVVHVMQPAIRQYYRLEEIWGEKPVRLKLGAARPRKVVASEDASATAPAKTPARKAPARRKTADAAPAAEDAEGKAPAKKAAARKSPAKTAAAGKTARSAATGEAAARPAAKKTTAKKAPAKTVVVDKPAARKTATKTAAKAPAKTAAKTAVKTAARKAPARKTAASKA